MKTQILLGLALVTGGCLSIVQTFDFKFQEGQEGYCANFLNYTVTGPGSLQINYEPILDRYVVANLTVQSERIGIDRQSQLLFEMCQVNSTENITKNTVGTFQESLPGPIYYAVFPFSTNVDWSLELAIPIQEVETSAEPDFPTGASDTEGNPLSGPCFDLSALLAYYNTTVFGFVAFNSTDKKSLAYVPTNFVNCTAEQVSRQFAGKNASISADFADGAQPLRTNCGLFNVTRPETFINEITYNWAFWVLITSVVFTTIFVAYTDSEMLFESGFNNNFKTHHPFYSLHNCATENFTKGSRIMQIAIAWAAIVWFNALIVKTHSEAVLPIKLILIPICSVIFAIPFQLLTGFLLTRVYKQNYILVESLKRTESHDARMVAIEIWEREQFRAYFLFYSVSGILCLIMGIMSIYFMMFFYMDVQGWFLLGSVIGIFEFVFVWDLVITLMAKSSEAISRFAKIRGFWFDYETELEFENQKIYG